VLDQSTSLLSALTPTRADRDDEENYAAEDDSEDHQACGHGAVSE
jgi:hypothetical protein